MNHLQSFSDFLSLNEGEFVKRMTFFPPEFNSEGGIPIYNALKFQNNPGMRPEITVNRGKIIDSLLILLEKQEEGVVDEILLTADVPSQGKAAPQYLVDELTAERKRLRDKILSRFGGRIEAKDYPEIACEKCKSSGLVTQEDGQEVTCPSCNGKGVIREAPQEINLFIDTEYILTGIENKNGENCAVALPLSKKVKISKNPNLADYYKTYITSKQILEVFFEPY